MKVIPIIFTIIFTSIGQILIKKGVNELPHSNINDSFSFIKFLISSLFNPWIFFGFALAFAAAFCWILALRTFELSSIYIYQSLNFILVPILAYYFFSESFSLHKIFGTILIIIGLFVFSK